MHLRRRNREKKANEQKRRAWMKRACFASSWKKWETREAGYLAFDTLGAQNSLHSSGEANENDVFAPSCDTSDFSPNAENFIEIR